MLVACPNLPDLERYASGDLDAPLRVSIAGHVESCESCRSRLEDLSRNASLEQRLGDLRPTSFREIRGTDLPASIGPYRVLHEIGRGGMGVVLLAEQERPRRQVALKVMHPFGTTRTALRRFELEADTLGRLEHPGIAAMYETGIAEVRGERLPYLAMEYVAGSTLDQALEQRRPPLGERLRWFLDVADAIRFAHRNGVLHRDLKPGNVLVDLAQGRVKVIDFGLAQELGGDDSFRTETGQVLGTLAYMSPEQTGLGVADTRTDVYGLGALLYYILCLRPPLDLAGCSIPQALTRIQQQDPTRPNAVVSQIDRPLDWIVLRALEKDADRRYASVDELIADIDAYLTDRPVIAAPRSRAYRLRLLWRRRRLEISAAGLLLLSLVAGLVATTISLGRESRALAAATREKETTDEVRRLMVTVLDQVDPNSNLGESLSARQLILRAAEEVLSGLDDRPEVGAPLLEDLARILRGLGDPEEAERLLREAFALRLAGLGPNATETLHCEEQLGLTLVFRGDARAALPLLEHATSGLRRNLGNDAPELSHPMASLGQAYAMLQRHEEAEAAFEESGRLAAAETGDLNAPGAPDLLVAYHLMYTGGIGDAVAACEDAVTRRINLAYGLHEIPQARGLLGLGLTLLGRHDEAENTLNIAVSEMEDVFGESHPKTLMTLDHLARLLHRTDRSPEAEVLLRRIMDRARDHMGTFTKLAWAAQTSLGDVLRERGDFDDAKALLEEAERALLRYGPSDTHLLTCRYHLGQVLRDLGEHDEAIVRLRQALAGWREQPGATVSTRVRVARDLAGCLAKLGDHAGARDVLLGELDRIDGMGTVDPVFALQYRVNLADAYRFLNDVPAMVRVLEPAIDLSEQFDDTTPSGQEYRHFLGWAYFRLGEPELAIPWMERVLNGRRELLGPTHPKTVKSENGLAVLFAATGRDAEAEELFRASLDHGEATSGSVDENQIGDDDLGWYRFKFAEFLASRGRFDEARAQIDAALALAELTDDTRKQVQTLRDQLPSP